MEIIIDYLNMDKFFIEKNLTTRERLKKFKTARCAYHVACKYILEDFWKTYNGRFFYQKVEIDEYNNRLPDYFKLINPDKWKFLDIFFDSWKYDIAQLRIYKKSMDEKFLYVETFEPRRHGIITYVFLPVTEEQFTEMEKFKYDNSYDVTQKKFRTFFESEVDFIKKQNL